MKVFELAAIHVGQGATIAGRDGVLMFGRVPGYGSHVKAWYLITPSSLKHFDEAAVSLQWLSNTDVELHLACVKGNAFCKGNIKFFNYKVESAKFKSGHLGVWLCHYHVRNR